MQLDLSVMSDGIYDEDHAHSHWYRTSVETQAAEQKLADEESGEDQEKVYIFVDGVQAAVWDARTRECNACANCASPPHTPKASPMRNLSPKDSSSQQSPKWEPPQLLPNGAYAPMAAAAAPAAPQGPPVRPPPPVPPRPAAIEFAPRSLDAEERPTTAPTLAPPSEPPNVPCSWACCWTHVHGRDGGAWMPGWLIFVDWVPDYVWSLGCLPEPWEEWIRGYLEAARVRKHQADQAALEEAMEGYREAARERKRLAIQRKQQEEIKALEDAGEAWKAIAVERQFKEEAAGRRRASREALEREKGEAKPPEEAAGPPKKAPFVTRQQRMAAQGLIGPPRSPTARKRGSPKRGASSPSTSTFIAAAPLPPPSRKPMLPPLPAPEDDELQKSPPSKREVDHALRYLGHSKKGQVAYMVQCVLEHENHVSAPAMSEGLADAVANARRERAERRSAARSPLGRSPPVPSLKVEHDFNRDLRGAFEDNPLTTML